MNYNPPIPNPPTSIFNSKEWTGIPIQVLQGNLSALSLNITNTTPSTTTTTGSLICAGGVGIALGTHIGGQLHITNISSNALRIGAVDNSDVQYVAGIQVGTSATIGTASAHSLILKTNNTTALTIGSSGLSTFAVSTLITGSYTPINTSPGLEMGYVPGSNVSNIYSFDRLNTLYKNLNLNDTIYLNASKQVGINTTAQAVVFQVNAANSTQNTNATWTIASDSRLKDEIVEADLDICWKNIESVPLHYYKWKDHYTEEERNYDLHKVGFIADHIEKVYPKAINTHNQYGLDDCKSMNINDHLMALFGTVKLLQKRIIELEEKNVASNIR